MALNTESNLVNGLALGLDNSGVRTGSVSLWRAVPASWTNGDTNLNVCSTWTHPTKNSIHGITDTTFGVQVDPAASDQASTPQSHSSYGEGSSITIDSPAPARMAREILAFISRPARSSERKRFFPSAVKRSIF
jgi:hypothetical protein